MKRAELIHLVREIVLGNYYGVLATQSEGYPYGSLARYSIDSQGQPILMLSRIAEHTKNLKNGDKLSLFIMKFNEKNIQECPRVNLMGSLEILQKEHSDFEACLQSYYAYFPETQDYFENLDFNLYRFVIDGCRYIGGFAAAHLLSGNDYRQNNPLDDATCQRIISHMNEDHGDAILHYCESFNVNVNENTPVLVAVDAKGFQLRIGSSITRINFPQPITDSVSARKALVAMAQK